MAPIRGMQVDLITHEDPDSGTNDEVYIGSWGTGGGREFPLSSPDINDFEAAQVKYILGRDPGPIPAVAERPSRSRPGEANDPQALLIELASVQYVYIRKQAYGKQEDDNAYKLRSVVVVLYGDPGVGGSRSFFLDAGRNGLWLGNEHGHTAWLRGS